MAEIMESSKQDSLLKIYVKITSVVVLYWVVSISMVFLNKSLLGGASMGEKDAPLFITCFQCAVTALLCFIVSTLTKISPVVISFPHLGVPEKQKIEKVLPLTFMFVSMMACNNLCLKYVGVAFYYVGRSLAMVFNVIFSYLLLGEKTSFPAILCCATIIIGFGLGVDQEGAAGSLSVRGVIFGIMAAIFVALNAIFTKKVLPVVNGSIWELSYYNNLIAIVLFLPLIVITGELPAIMMIVKDSALSYWSLLFLSGLFGFGIGFVTGLQIKVTSPLTHGISGTAKACFQTVMATWWYSDFKSGLWWLSNWLVLGGSMAYTRVKQLQMKHEHNARIIGENLEQHTLTSPVERKNLLPL